MHDIVCGGHTLPPGRQPVAPLRRMTDAAHPCLTTHVCVTIGSYARYVSQLGTCRQAGSGEDVGPGKVDFELGGGGGKRRPFYY